MSQQPAPTIISAIPQLNGIQLNWAPSLDMVLFYDIQYSNNGGTSWTTIPQIRPSVYSYSILNLSSSSSYLLRISARYRTYITPYSSAVGPITPLSLTPSSPTNLAVSASSQTLNISWNRPTNIGASPILAYYIEYSSNSGSSWTTVTSVPSSVLSWSITSLNNGTNYIVRVRAENQAGFGTYATSLPVLVFGRPSAPRNLTSSVPTSGNAVNLRFLEPINHGGKLITTYRIKYAGFKTLKEAQDYIPDWSTSQPPVGNPVPVSGKPDILEFANPHGNIDPTRVITRTVSNLTNGLFYTFIVRSINNLPVSQNTVSDFTKKIIVRPKGLPQAPTNIDIDKIGDQQISISWSAPANTGGIGIPILNYIVQYHNGTNWFTYDDGYNTNTFTTVINLTNGTPYIFRVAAVNNVGAGPYSNVSVTAIPGAKPLTAPTSVNGISMNKSVLLSWTVPTDTGGVPITHYNIQYSSNNGTSWVSFSNITSTNLGTLVTGLTNNVSYIFRVSASNTIGTGPWSANSAPITPAAKAPSAPRNLVGKPLDSSAVLSWDIPSDDNGSAITAYTIQSSLNNGLNWSTIVQINSSQTTYIAQPLVNGQSYIFRVAAINGIGTGDYSNNSNIVIPKPAPVQNILCDKQSIIDAIDSAYAFGLITSIEPWKSYFIESADRLGQYLRYKTNVISAIRNQVGNNWNGALVSSIDFVYDESGPYVAYAGPDNVIDFTINGTSDRGFNTISYFVGINTYYANQLTNSNWVDTITHEILHGLGFGLFWNDPFQPSGGKLLPQKNQGFLSRGANDYALTSIAYVNTVNTQWPNASISPFQSNQVPLTSGVGAGSDYYHWSHVARNYNRNQTHPGLKNDVMGPYAPRPGQKDVLSLLTIKSLVEFGYDEINPGTSEGVPVINLSPKSAAASAESNEVLSGIGCGCNHLHHHIDPNNIIKVVINP